MLVLGGETYMDRLWCVWELYTLFAVSDLDPALIVRDFAAAGGLSLKERPVEINLLFSVRICSRTLMGHSISVVSGRHPATCCFC